VKTTIEIPDPIFRKAKARAAERGQSLRELVTEALRDKLTERGSGPPPFLAGFGELRRLRRETRRIQAVIDETFEVIEPEDRA
jgi:hypothetical protein